jgi:hypothetical protein
VLTCVVIATAWPGGSRYKRFTTVIRGAMTSDQAAQLIDDTLDLVHRRLQDLQGQALGAEQRALAAEFREWRHPEGGHIDLMVFPGLASS